jgi:hypothetical protein
MIASIFVGFISSSACAPEKKVKDLDLVTDVAADVVGKANAILTGSLEVTMSKSKPSAPDKYFTNVIGQKVPKSTVSKTGSY